jgi:hypothetical protein
MKTQLAAVMTCALAVTNSALAYADSAPDACLASYEKGVPNSTALEPVVKALKAAKLTKGEFETKDEFVARSAASVSNALKAASINPENRLIFRTFSIAPTYDADKQAYILSDRTNMAPIVWDLLPPKSYDSNYAELKDLDNCPSSDAYLSHCNENIIVDKVKYSKPTSYTASNGYGAVVKVQKIRGAGVGIRPGYDGSIQRDEGKPELGLYDKMDASLAMPRDQAAAVKTNLRVSFCFQMAAPWIETGKTFQLPERGLPIDSEVSYDLLIARTAAYVIFNTKTGEVYRKAALTVE